MHKLAADDMQKYIDDGHQDEDEAHLKKLQVDHLAPHAEQLPVSLTYFEDTQTTACTSFVLHYFVLDFTEIAYTEAYSLHHSAAAHCAEPSGQQSCKKD